MTQIPYWQALCTLLSVRFEDLPWRPEDRNRRRQAIYFNSGIFVWRRCSSFASAYREAFQRLIDSRLAQHDGSFFTADQVILSPILIREGLRWQHLHFTDHHMIFQGQLVGNDASPHLGQSALIHYSRSLHRLWREVFLARIGSECPSLLGSYSSGGAHQIPRDLVAHLPRFALENLRHPLTQGADRQAN